MKKTFLIGAIALSLGSLVGCGGSKAPDKANAADIEALAGKAAKPVAPANARTPVAAPAADTAPPPANAAPANGGVTFGPSPGPDPAADAWRANFAEMRRQRKEAQEAKAAAAAANPASAPPATDAQKPANGNQP